jgi:D-glycero-D-manno-heptose 1,7-bisphosphate phosphatase
MRAVFVNEQSVLRDSHIDPNTPPEAWRLMPATLEAMRLLAQEDVLLFLFGQCAPSPKDGKDTPGFQALVDQIEAAGGRVDGTIACQHGANEDCACWGESPGLLWLVASRFDLHLDECYVLGDTERDAIAACAAGARPFIILCERSIDGILGDLPHRKDIPIAVDLSTAVRYVNVEEEINRQLGHLRDSALPLPTVDLLHTAPEALPELTVTSRLARSIQSNVAKSQAQLRDIGRWLTFLVLGAVGLSLGIAYLLTHLYRMQRFPAYIYYITLQFIPRPLRGALFILWGAGVLFLAVRSFARSANIRRKRSG